MDAWEGAVEKAAADKDFQLFKICPFCGCKNIDIDEFIDEKFGHTGFYLAHICKGSMISIMLFASTRYELMKKWNHRGKRYSEDWKEEIKKCSNV